jgi:hypothetical protein
LGGRITNNVPVFYMARDVMILMQATSFTRAIGRGGPKKVEIFQGPPLPIARVTDLPATKSSSPSAI